MLENYSDEIQKALKKEKIEIGHRISMKNGEKQYEGFLMPKSAGSPNMLVIKLDSGYNIGIDFSGAKIIKMKEKREMKAEPKIKNQKSDKGMPTIVIMTTGGTIASRVDYKTGAVTALETPDEILTAVPEMAEIANIRTRTVFQMASEDMEPEHWCILAKKISEEISETNPDGIIITHGTDIMHYTAAALSFMLQDLPIPVLLVGSQRSSDRGSSDAIMNLVCAAQFIAKGGFSGVALLMHGSESDDYCFVHQGTHVKKMHTSRRDTFRSIDVMPYAKVFPSGTIEFLRNDYQKKDKKRRLQLLDRFDKRIALVKIHPAFNYKQLEFYEKEGYRGIILEGTGLGHVPMNVTDDFTKHHKLLLETIERMIKNGVVIAMTSQCPYGVVNMNIYRPQRILQDAGVIPLAMMSETAFVKLGWSLGHTKDIGEAKKILLKDCMGEFTGRIDSRVFD